MAHFRIPGPLDGSRHSLWVDDGTLQRHAGMRPGPVGLGEAGWMDRLDPWGLRQRAEDVLEAVQRAGPRVPAAVARETGEAVDALIEGLLPGLLLMIAVIGVTTAIGGAAGAVVGFLAGGVGAAPGAALGAQAGASAGVWLLTWLGLGFLVVAMADGLGELGGLCMQAARLAWEAREHPDRNSRVDRAADRLADAVALLLKLILMAIVARLTLGQARTAGANLDETITQLRNSRLGAGFADWVAANAARLQRNPKLQPRAQRTEAQAVSEAQTPSQLRRRAGAAASAPPEAPSAQAPRGAQILRTRRAEDVNATYPAGYQPPYKPGTQVLEFRAQADEVFVRVHGEANQARSWMMRAEDIQGLTPEQIRSKFALPELPSFVSEVHVPAGTAVRTGVVNPIFGGTGNATQFELLTRLPSSAFQNMRPLSGGG